MHKQLHTALIVAGLLVIGTQGHAAETKSPTIPGVVKIQDMMTTAGAAKSSATANGQRIKRGGGCYVSTMGAVGWNVTLKCDQFVGEEVSVQQIYERGWRVVTSHVYPDRAMHILIIEEQ